MEDDDFEGMLGKLFDPHSPRGYKLGMSLKDMFYERIKEMGITQNQAEDMLGIEYRALMAILNRTAKRVDVLNLMKLSQFLGITNDEMLNLYTREEMRSDAIGKIEQAKKHSFIAQNFDLNALKKVKFFPTVTDMEAVEKRIVKFFGLQDIYEYANMMYFPAFSRTKKTSSDLMREFWVKSAYRHFVKIDNPHVYSRDALVELMPKIRPYTRNEKDGLLTVIRALYTVGVTVIYQPHLTNVQVRGATFVVKGKPCIVLTDVYKNYPTLWFALIHELYHVLYDYEALVNQTYHLTGDEDLLLSEESADSFAREYLFSDEAAQYILPFINDDFIVRDYANEERVHPSIIYAFHNHDMKASGQVNAWAKKSRQNWPKVNDALKEINTGVWEKEEIDQNVEAIKKIFKTNKNEKREQQENR